jgi:hypothetical protein
MFHQTGLLLASRALLTISIWQGAASPQSACRSDNDDSHGERRKRISSQLREFVIHNY